VEDEKTQSKEIERKNEKLSVDLSKVDPISRSLVAIRSKTYEALTSHPKIYDYGVPIAVHGISLAYLAGALVYHFQKGW